MILKTPGGLGPQHCDGIAQRIEQASGKALAVPYGSLVKLEQESFIEYRRKHVHRQRRQWEQTVNIMARFFNQEKETA